MPLVRTAPRSILERNRAGIATRPLPSTLWKYSPRNIRTYSELPQGSTLPHFAPRHKYMPPTCPAEALYPRVFRRTVDKTWTRRPFVHDERAGRGPRGQPMGLDGRGGEEWGEADKK